MSRKSASRWPTSGYAPHVNLSRKEASAYKVECDRCGAHEIIPDSIGGDLDEIRSFNMAIQAFTTTHAGCPERGEQC